MANFLDILGNVLNYGSATKGYIIALDGRPPKEKPPTRVFQYNPTIFEYSRNVTYSEISAPGMSYPSLQFVKGEGRSFSVSLFFYDNPFTNVIPDFIYFLESYFLPPEYNPNFGRDYDMKPCEMQFCYGGFLKICVLESLNISNERFDKSGNPIQATLTLQLRQVSD